MSESYYCLLCKKTFTTKSGLRKHCAAVHQETLGGDVIAGRPFSMHAAKCFLCQISFKFIRELREHLKIKHNYNPETLSMEFSNILAFERWKKEIESKTYTKYRQQCGNKNGLNYYACHCRATGVQYLRRHGKFRIAYKTHKFCTSQIVVSNRNGIKVVFHGRHYGHSQVPVDAITEFYALNELPPDNTSTEITKHAKKFKQEPKETNESDYYSKLNGTVLDLFQRKIKSTTNDIENEISKLMGKEITCDMAENLKSAWRLIKQAKMKLIEANELSTEKETTDSKLEVSQKNSTEFEEKIKRKRKEMKEEINVKRSRFDSISVVDGSIRLRRYDDKYKSSNIDIIKTENDEDEFDDGDDNFGDYDLSNFLTFPVREDDFSDPSEYFDYDDFLNEFNGSDLSHDKVNVTPIL